MSPDGVPDTFDEALRRSILAVLPDGVVVQDAKGVIIEVNAAAERILGLTADQMMGLTSADPTWRAIHPDGSDWPGDSHPVSVVRATGEAVSDAVMGIYKPDGRLTWILINAIPVGQVGDSDFRAVVTFADVTELREAHEALQASNNALRELAAIASHELQSPLRRIGAYADLVVDSLAADSPAVDMVARIVANVALMREVTAELTSLIRLEADLDRARVAVAGLVEQAVALVAELADRQGATVDTEVPEDLVADVDAGQIVSLLVHLLTNSLKYREPSRETRVSVSAWADAALLRIRVTDNGVGIAEEHLERLLTPFQHLPGSQGHGMGLAVSSRIAQLHGGSIAIASEEDRGTTVTVTIPRRLIEAVGSR